MSTGEPARTAVRRTRSPLVGPLVVAIAALIGVHAHQSQAASSPFAPPAAQPTVADPPRADDLGRFDGKGVDDGDVPDGVTVFDDDIPAVAGLDPSLRDAMRRATTQAAAGGIDVVINSGWRSPAYQERLLDEAVARYGSRREAARWVATPDTSAHVSGDAVDIGPSAAATWLARHGTAYGLCQIYRNEPWHFELRPEATAEGCPTMYADPTHDPLMQQQLRLAR